MEEPRNLSPLPLKLPLSYKTYHRSTQQIACSRKMLFRVAILQKRFSRVVEKKIESPGGSGTHCKHQTFFLQFNISLVKLFYIMLSYFKSGHKTTQKIKRVPCLSYLFICKYKFYSLDLATFPHKDLGHHPGQLKN